jgi:prepilin-type N-terminal cleavage/methylation domain-containing protein
MYINTIKRKYRNKRGFTIIEGLVALFVFSILVVTFYKLFTATMMHMQDSKYRRGAVALAYERMEHFRNMPYPDIGTQANVPFGNIEDDERITVNGLNYRIIVSVFYIDDPADGESPADSIPTDYKRVSTSIVWGKAFNDGVSKYDAVHSDMYRDYRVTLVTQFIPPGGLETADESSGVLSINVLNDYTEPISPVSGATVIITDNDCGATGHPDCSHNIFSGTTDSDGNFMYVGAPLCTDCYEIVIAKAGYETRSTKDAFIGNDGIDPIEEGEYEPLYKHQGVISGELTAISFNTNKISQMTIISQDPFGNLIPGVTFDIKGGEKLGVTSDGDNVCILDEQGVVTDSTTAEVDILTQSDAANCSGSSKCYANAGLYKISNMVMPSGYEDYLFWKVVPNDENEMSSISLLADTDTDVKMIFGDSKYDSVGVRVLEDVDGTPTPVPDAIVQLKSTTLDPEYDVSQSAGNFGYAYFPVDEADPLVNGETYDITVTADGYNEGAGTVTIDELQLVDITITPDT